MQVHQMSAKIRRYDPRGCVKRHISFEKVGKNNVSSNYNYHTQFTIFNIYTLILDAHI